MVDNFEMRERRRGDGGTRQGRQPSRRDGASRPEFATLPQPPNADEPHAQPPPERALP